MVKWQAMNLRHIEIFHAVYSTGSVSAAARALNVSQPSVTKVLQHAESLLGFPLFERSKGRLVPTPDADALFENVADIQDRVYQLRQVSRNMRQGRGTLRIACLPSLGLKAVPDAVGSFMAGHPDVSFDLHTIHHADHVRKLYEQETDLVICFDAPRNVPVRSIQIGRGEMVALFRREDCPNPTPRLALDRLGTQPFITTAESGPQGRLLTAEMARLTVQLNEVASSKTFFVAAGLVRAGVGFTITDSFTAEAYLTPELDLRPLDPPLAFDVLAIYLESRPPSTLARTFLEHFEDILIP